MNSQFMRFHSILFDTLYISVTRNMCYVVDTLVKVAFTSQPGLAKVQDILTAFYKVHSLYWLFNILTERLK